MEQNSREENNEEDQDNPSLVIFSSDDPEVWSGR